MVRNGCQCLTWHEVQYDFGPSHQPGEDTGHIPIKEGGGRAAGRGGGLAGLVAGPIGRRPTLFLVAQ